MIDFTSGNPMKQILMFSVPLLLGNFLQNLFQIADTIIVGRFIGGTALAAVGSSMAIIQLLVAAFVGLTTGASVVISQFFGARKEEELKRTVTTSMIAMGVLSVILMVFGFFGAGAMLRLLGVDDVIFDDAVIYLRTFMVGIAFPLYLNIYMAYMRALGDSKSPLILLAISAVLNVIFTISFIVVFDWGIFGAGLATIVAQGLAVFACIFIANRKIQVLKIRLSELVFDRAMFKLILTYGIPASIQMSITGFASLTIMRLVNSLGAVATAGFSAGLRAENFGLMPLMNMNMAISTFVGQNIGAGNEERAKLGLKSGMKLMIGIGAFTSIVLLILSQTLMGWFVSPEDINAQGIIYQGTLYLWSVSLFYILFGIFFAFNGFFRGVGDQVIVMVLTISSLTIRAVLAHIFVLVFGLGLDSLAWSIAVGWFLCGTFAYFYYRSGKWRGKAAMSKLKTEEE
ncbi:MAG: MATE family efflux transporter [Defluviitaleaceae bacterium]|nr:MATE family efflux transporter [Defluviitaleaceae bacterium]